MTSQPKGKLLEVGQLRPFRTSKKLAAGDRNPSSKMRCDVLIVDLF